ncbi:hypothetical protein GCM10027341_02340 [Spirosoma knui]
MEITQSYKHSNKTKAAFISIWTFLRLYTKGFIQANASVFEGLTRMAAPWGGNWLGSTDRYGN